MPTTRKQVVIVGCGRMGAEMALSISSHHCEVCAIDINPQAFDRLGADFRGRTVQGEGFDRNVLERAGIERADAFAAVTGLDSVNFVAARVARDIYHVPNVVARVYNPRCNFLYAQFNLVTIDSSTWGARRIEQLLLLPSLESSYDLGSGDVKIYELSIPEAWEGKPMSDLLPGEGTVPVALTREATGFVPDRDTVLRARDLVHVGATAGAAAQLRRRLNPEK